MDNVAIGMRTAVIPFSDGKTRLQGADDVAEAVNGASTAAKIDDAEDSRQVTASGDTVTISDEAREKAQGSAIQGQGKTGGDDEGPSQKDFILRQIKEVQKKLQDAQARLAEAQGNAGSTGETNGEGSSPDAALEDAAAQMLGGNAEAKAIQAEINMLTQQLMALNQQLMSGGGGDSGGGIRAGIGGESDGPSGQGQRISVSA